MRTVPPPASRDTIRAETQANIRNQIESCCFTKIIKKEGILASLLVIFNNLNHRLFSAAANATATAQAPGSGVPRIAPSLT